MNDGIQTITMTTLPFSDRKQNLRFLLIGLLLAALTSAVYSPVRSYDFVNYDDDLFVYENPNLQQGLTPDTVRWALTAGLKGEDENADYWRPLSYLSHALDIELFGWHAGGHHLMSVGLHAAAVVALFWALLSLTGAPWRSAFVAALFAVHPLRVESVAWVAERKDVLSGLFFFLTLGAYASYARRSFSLWRYLAVVVLFILAVMSKPIVVTLPFVLLLLDHWPLGRFQAGNSGFRIPRSVILEKIPLFALSGFMSVFTWLMQREIGAVKEGFSLSMRTGNALVSYVTYIWQTVYPTGLAVLYPYDMDLPLWKVVGAAILVLCMTAFVLWQLRRLPYLAVGWFWYLGMLAPVIGFFSQAGVQAHADRYTYLPQIGLFIVLTWGVAGLSVRWSHRRVVCGTGAALVLVALIGCTLIQTSYWRNSVTLWTHALASTRPSPVAHNNLANELAAQGRLTEAADHYRKALVIHPGAGDAHNNLGILLAYQGKIADAIDSYRRALAIDPDYVEARANLGAALISQGNFAEAVEQFEAALNITPDAVSTSNNLAWLLATCPDARFRDGERAVELAQKAEQLTGGNHPAILCTLAAAYAEAGRFSEAVETARLALDLAKERGDQALAEALVRHLDLYELGIAFHDQ
ncbi:MAG: tetratricopeptide repeat protein [Akkermansiaceae bacterium]|nr:tetratricopeptide repeat protein [Akkermansiaceae bacterium]